MGNSTVSGNGGGTSTSRTKKYNVNKQNNGASNSVIGGSSGIGAYARDDTDVVIASSEGGASGNAGRETHSCPSSPTETDCSSGFSTLRKRSVTVTEKVKLDYMNILNLFKYFVVYCMTESIMKYCLILMHRYVQIVTVAKPRLCANTGATRHRQIIQTRTCHTSKILTCILMAHRKVCHFCIKSSKSFKIFL